MKIGILGTGGVGQTLSAKLVEGGHEVMLGTRDVAATLAKAENDPFGNPPFKVWYESHSTIALGTFAEAAAHGEVLINATSGYGSIPALEAAGNASIDGKILLDISNPLDFSKGFPPSLFVSNTDSLAEQIQRAFPAVKVVKTLNSTTAAVMVNPGLVAGGDHHMFVAGDDAEAKAAVMGYLRDWFGWQHILDLGDLSAARATEMLLPAWLRLYGALGTPLFNFKIVQ